jgi:hypothetical protein
MSDYQTSYQPPMGAAQQTHTLAIVSLIFGILGLVGVCPGIGAVVAIVTGNMAQNEIRANSAQYTGEGLAKAGVILGWVGVGLIVVGLCCFVAYFAFIFIAASSSSDSSSPLRLAPVLFTWARAMLG